MTLTIAILILTIAILPFIICPIIIKVAEFRAIQNTEKRYKEHIFRNGVRLIFHLSSVTSIFVVCCCSPFIVKESGPILMMFIITVIMGYRVLFHFLKGKPIVFIGDETLVIKYLTNPYKPVLKARFSELSYYEPYYGFFVFYVSGKGVFEIDINFMGLSHKLIELLRTSLKEKEEEDIDDFLFASVIRKQYELIKKGKIGHIVFPNEYHPVSQEQQHSFWGGDTNKPCNSTFFTTLTIIFGLTFIGIYTSFFIKGEFDELYVFILGLVAICLSMYVIYRYGFNNISTACLIFAGISILTCLFGDNFLNEKHWDGTRTVWGHNIGKADNYIERYYTNDKGEELLYKGEYKYFKKDSRSRTRYWHGKGALYKKYTVEVKAGYKDEKQTYHKKNVYKLLYNGTWNKNKRHGTGTRYWYHDNGHIKNKYVGSFVNGRMTGIGTYYHAEDGNTTRLRPMYSGQWMNNRYHGHGILYGNKGKTITIAYEGEFKNGEKVK